MTIILVALAVPLIALAGGFLLSAIERPPPKRPETLVNRLWASRSIWRAK